MDLQFNEITSMYHCYLYLVEDVQAVACTSGSSSWCLFCKEVINNVPWQASEQEEMSRESLFLGVKVKGLA